MAEQHITVSHPAPMTLTPSQRAEVDSWVPTLRAKFESIATRLEFFERQTLAEAEAEAFGQCMASKAATMTATRERS